MGKTRKQTRGLEHVDEQIGATIRRARLALGMSQGALGDRMNVTFQQIQKYESGMNAVASTRILVLCKVLGLTPNELCGWNRADEPSSEWSAAAVRLAIDFEALSSDARAIVAQVVNAVRDIR
jgi:transcriptional regulator with XRE-family HTH domain